MQFQLRATLREELTIIQASSDPCHLLKRGFRPPLQSSIPKHRSIVRRARRIHICAMSGDAKEAPGTAVQCNNPPSTVHRASRPLLEALNESTKWTVSLLVFGILLYRRDLLSAWGVSGSIVAAIVCKILKFIIQESRPLGSARKADPGMPSSHANSLSFLSTFVSLSVIARTVPGSVGYAALGLGVPAAAVFLAWLRVAFGYHTTAQVVLGWLLGSSLAAVWISIGNNVALPFLQAHPESQWQLWFATTVAVAVFVGQNGAHWAAELRERRRRSL